MCFMTLAYKLQPVNLGRGMIVVVVVRLEHSHSFVTIQLRRDPLRVDVAGLQGMQ